MGKINENGFGVLKTVIEGSFLMIGSDKFQIVIGHYFSGIVRKSTFVKALYNQVFLISQSYNP